METDDSINDSPGLELGEFLEEWREEIVHACPSVVLPGIFLYIECQQKLVILCAS